VTLLPSQAEMDRWQSALSPGESKHKEFRYLDIYDDQYDEAQLSRREEEHNGPRAPGRPTCCSYGKMDVCARTMVVP
jgi:hypothetical protein